jgi:hypothetical protein
MRKYQAPVFAASSCGKPRKDWEFDVLQDLFSAKRIERRMFEPWRKRRRMRVARTANNRRGSEWRCRARHSAGMMLEKSRASAGPDFDLLDAKKHWNHWDFSRDAECEKFSFGRRDKTPNHFG